MGKLLDENSLLAIKEYVDGKVKLDLLASGTISLGTASMDGGNLNATNVLMIVIDESKLLSDYAILIFTYGNCFVMLPTAGTAEDHSYYATGSASDDIGSISNKPYRYQRDNDLIFKIKIHDTNEVLPAGYTYQLIGFKI